MGSQVDPQTMLNLLREQCTDIASKVNAMEMDKTEHTLVIQALEPLPEERKCFRMIGNVVVERTVGEVLPAVQKNRDQVQGRRAEPGLPPPARASVPELVPSLVSHLKVRPLCSLLCADFGDDLQNDRDAEREAEGGRRVPEEAQNLVAKWGRTLGAAAGG